MSEIIILVNQKVSSGSSEWMDLSRRVTPRKLIGACAAWREKGWRCGKVIQSRDRRRPAWERPCWRKTSVENGTHNRDAPGLGCMCLVIRVNVTVCAVLQTAPK